MWSFSLTQIMKNEPLVPRGLVTAPQLSLCLPQKVNFMAQYKQQSCIDVNGLEEFLKLPQEDFKNCNPIQWWAGQRAQFPGLSWYARDIFSIPGEFLFRVLVLLFNQTLPKGSAIAVK